VAGVLLALSIALVCWQNPITLVIWALDGSLAAIILLLAALAGHAVLPLFRLGCLEPAWRWLLSTGLGIGVLATLVLACGLCGLIGPEHRWACPLLLCGLAIVGAATLLRAAPPAQPPPPAAGPGRLRWLLVAAAPFLALILIVATIPPGILWQEEGRGYDVLEYHLQLPKEYFQAGVIRYLPHNVYANFPANAEMLYLAGCIATGQPVESWSVSQCINTLLALLFVAATWLVCRERSPGAGVIGGALAASAGWVTYLSGLAYVENGMLFMGMLACGCVLRAVRAADPRHAARWLALAGTLAGLSCGFKYPAVALIAAPLLAFALIVLKTRRARAALYYGLGFLAAFSPWLIKNAVLARNPVFPLLGGVFTSYPPGWGAKEAQHFTSAHAPAPEESGLRARLQLLVRHVVFDPDQRFGPILLVLAFAALLRGPTRRTCGLLAMLVIQVAVWLFATHLYARFAVPLLIPLLVLAARGVEDVAGRVTRPMIALVVVGIAFNLYPLARLYHAHVYAGRERLDFEGASMLFTEGRLTREQHLAAINLHLPADAKVLLVGDSRPFYYLRSVDYCVVFNRSPFVQVVEESPTIADVIAWLRAHGYSHVYVDWLEISRLRRSRYGFPEAVTASLFEQLADEGLQRVADFSLDPDKAYPYGTLYAVP